MTTSERWEDANGLALYWKMSRAGIYNLLPRGLPSRKIGRSRRFWLPDCDRWAAERDEVADLEAGAHVA